MQDTTSDPFGIIPDNWELKGQLIVVGYCNPAGDGPMDLMVKVKYPNYVKNCHGYSTTQHYTSILRHYYLNTSLEEINNRRGEYITKRGNESLQNRIAAKAAREKKNE